ncbi:MAG: hypothetical protein WDN08_12475 [Rhizomicrobium sp.]
MTAKRTKRATKAPAGDLVGRLQGMLYEFHEFGRFDEARPHILWLMEIAEKEAGRMTPPAARM